MSRPDHVRNTSSSQRLIVAGIVSSLTAGNASQRDPNQIVQKQPIQRSEEDDDDDDEELVQQQQQHQPQQQPFHQSSRSISNSPNTHQHHLNASPSLSNMNLNAGSNYGQQSSSSPAPHQFQPQPASPSPPLVHSSSLHRLDTQRRGANGSPLPREPSVPKLQRDSSAHSVNRQEGDTNVSQATGAGGSRKPSVNGWTNLPGAMPMNDINNTSEFVASKKGAITRGEDHEQATGSGGSPTTNNDDEEENPLDRQIAFGDEPGGDGNTAIEIAHHAVAKGDTTSIKIKPSPITSPLQHTTTLATSATAVHKPHPSGLSEFAREMEHKFGKPSHGFARLYVQRKSFFDRPSLWHFLHRPQLKQYFKGRSSTLVRQNYERKAHWNELFFDLVFICVFQRVAHELHNSEHLDGRALTEFSVLFCAAWKIWFDLTVYVNQFDPTDTLHKVYFLLQMIFVMGLAVMSVKGVIGSYLAATGTTLLLRCWGAYYSPRARQDAYIQVVIYVLSSIPWLASLSVANDNATIDSAGHSPAGRAEYSQFELWAVGLFIAYGGQFLAQCHPRFHVPLNIEHITERFGIFTILCMGEQVVNILFSDTTASTQSFQIGILGGIMIFACQILYYDIDGFNHRMHALRGSRFRGYAWALLHCPFQGAIIISSVTFNFFIDSTLTIHPLEERVEFYAAKNGVGTTWNGTVEEAFDLGQNAMDAAVLATYHGTESVQLITAAHRQLFCVANGGILSMLFLIACLHVSRDGQMIRRRWRMIARGLGTCAMFILHLLGDRISPLGMMAYGAFSLMVIAIIDIYGGYVPRKQKVVYESGTADAAGAAPLATVQDHGDAEHEHSTSQPPKEESVMSQVW